VQVLGISFDTVPDNAAFAQKFGFDFPLLSDTTRAVGLLYGAAEHAQAQHAKRISYLIDPDGTIRRAFPKVNAAAHPEEILAAL
jgi:peroxiredoxin Q/BCP